MIDKHYQNNPHKKSNEMGPNPLDAIQKLPALDQAAHHKQVEATIKAMGLKEHETTDYERLMQEGARRVKNVRDWASLEVQAAIASGKDTTSGTFRAYIATGVLDRLVENFSHYNKDQLVHLMANFAFNAIVREVL